MQERALRIQYDLIIRVCELNSAGKNSAYEPIDSVYKIVAK